MYRSSPFRSTLSSKKSPNAKTRPRQKGPKPRKGCVSGSANVPVCGYIYIYTRIYYVDTTVYIVKGSTVLWGNVPLRPASCIWHHLAARQRHKLSSSRIHDIKDPLHAQVSEQDSKDTQFWVANGWHYKAPATMSEWTTVCTLVTFSCSFWRHGAPPWYISVYVLHQVLYHHMHWNSQECQPCWLPVWASPTFQSGSDRHCGKWWRNRNAPGNPATSASTLCWDLFSGEFPEHQTKSWISTLAYSQLSTSQPQHADK